MFVGTIATAAVPSGASTGIYEAVELRDGDQNDHFGKSTLFFLKYEHINYFRRLKSY